MTSCKVKAYLSMLSQTDEYQELFSRLSQLNEMQQVFSDLVPPNLSKHCHLGNLSDGKLIVYTENAAVASKLKLISPSLIRQLQRIGWQIKTIKIANRPLSSFQPRKHKHNRDGLKLSQQSIQSLQQLAEKVSDTELESAILSLISTHR